jgi:hypothetical protein
VPHKCSKHVQLSVRLYLKTSQNSYVTKDLLNEDNFFPIVKPRTYRVAVDVQLHSFVNFGIIRSSVVNFMPTSL